MLWSEIERIGREKYSLTDEWQLCAADASDIEIIKVEYGKKGPRGGWLRGKENTYVGYILNSNQQ